MPETSLASVVDAALREPERARRHRLLKGVEAIPEALDPTVEQRIEVALRDGVDIGVRTAAMDVCAALGGRVLPLLRRLLRDGNPRLRRLVVDALGLLGPPGRDLLVVAFQDEHLAVRTSAVDAFARVTGEHGIPTLLELLAQPTTAPAVALAALLGVDAAGGTVPRSSLSRWLDDALTASTALRLAGRAGDAAAIAPALTSPSPSRRRAALAGLAAALEHGAAPVDVGVAHGFLVASTTDPDPSVCASALLVLAHGGDITGLLRVAGREDVARILPTLHRVVEIAERTARPALDAVFAGVDERAGDVLRELAEASRRRQTLAAASPGVARGGAIREEDFARFAAWLEARAGITLTPDAQARIGARLTPRLEAAGVVDFAGYLRRIERDPDEAAAAIDAVTVHETYFFRERPALEGFRDEIVPTLARTRRKLRVWSAGCATGEEAFTVAWLLDDAVRAGVIDDYEVIGTDVSPSSIACARAARYGRRSFRDALTPAERGAFIWEAADRARPLPRLVQRVQFREMNLVVDDVGALPSFDVIFCRNVLIYFSRPARASVIERFHDRLVPGGALMLGHSESLLYVENPFEVWPLRRGLAYRRSVE